eukprot:131578-Rhodomonas_salina.2
MLWIELGSGPAKFRASESESRVYPMIAAVHAAAANRQRLAHRDSESNSITITPRGLFQFSSLAAALSGCQCRGNESAVTQLQVHGPWVGEPPVIFGGSTHKSLSSCTGIGSSTESRKCYLCYQTLWYKVLEYFTNCAVHISRAGVEGGMEVGIAVGALPTVLSTTDPAA